MGLVLDSHLELLLLSRVCSNRAELFRGVIGTSLVVVEYWLKATERIMDNVECSPIQRL